MPVLHPKCERFAILKTIAVTKSKRDMGNYLKKYAYLPTHERFANFSVLMFIANMLDIDTAIAIANSVARREKISDDIVNWIEGTVA